MLMSIHVVIRCYFFNSIQLETYCFIFLFLCNTLSSLRPSFFLYLLLCFSMYTQTNVRTLPVQVERSVLSKMGELHAYQRNNIISICFVIKYNVSRLVHSHFLSAMPFAAAIDACVYMIIS